MHNYTSTFFFRYITIVPLCVDLIVNLI